jgi:hypothetical protein
LQFQRRRCANARGLTSLALFDHHLSMNALLKPVSGQMLHKLAIITLFALVLGPVIILNCGVNLEKAGYPVLAARMQKAVPSLDALLLRQQWTLFTDISPFNYTTHFEVVLKDGSTLPLHDPAPQNATGWKGVLFHSESKIQNNLYGFPVGHRRYLEYLIRKNGINPAEVSQRIIYIRYRNLLPRSEAAAAGTHYGPEIRYDLQRY